jgi:hypothetical protein
LYLDSLHSYRYEQGSFDRLCGIYSVLNSIAVMSDDRIDSDKLFTAMVRQIGRQLPSVLLDGMSAEEMQRYGLDVAVAYCAQHRHTLRYRTLAKTDDLSRFWQSLDGHLRQHGAGSVVLAIWRSYNHWSCVRKLTERSIILLDSMRLSRIHRTSISLNERDKRRHLLCPQMTYLLSFE